MTRPGRTRRASCVGGGRGGGIWRRWPGGGRAQLGGVVRRERRQSRPCRARRDRLDRAADFYGGLLGFVETERNAVALYDRGYEEREHHLTYRGTKALVDRLLPGIPRHT